jgi:signal transduction histidine kinase
VLIFISPYSGTYTDPETLKDPGAAQGRNNDRKSLLDWCWARLYGTMAENEPVRVIMSAGGLELEANPCKPRVLIVDDAPENIQLLTEMLHEVCLPICATNGMEALKLANEDPAPDVILLDIMMPGMNGFEVCSRLKSEPKTRNIPIIFVTALNDINEEHKGLDMGGADYITRPFNANLVKTRVRYQLEMTRQRNLQDAALDPGSAPEVSRADLLFELSERKRLHEELCRLNEDLELQLAQGKLQLAAAREELQRESQRRTEEQKECVILNENLLRQRYDLDLVNRELESFSYSISHDLRAPLRHLLGFSGALQEDCADTLDDSARSFLGCITKAAKKMEAQIEALTGLSRIARQQLNLASVDLSCMVRESAASLQGSEPARQAVFTIADELLVRGDAGLLRAAIDNLLANAWKYTGKRDAAQIEFGRQLEGDASVFYLRDNGAGFDMRYADRLFGAFQRMHREGEFEGAGVGLAVVQRIIHRHGGRIWADATVDGGATFYFTLAD